MPTRNRAEFLPGAIKCFLEQDYDGDMELVILDDSDSKIYAPIGYNVPRRKISYSWMPQRARVSTGIKRNLVNALADGDVIIHWDDDDWNHPHRVAHQLEFLNKCGKPVTGYHTYLYYRISDGAGFRYYEPDLRPHAGGSSLCYRSSWWRDGHKFTDRVIGEDFIFLVEAKRGNNMASQDGEKYLVARNHGANTCNPSFGTRKFPPVDISKFPEGFLLTLPAKQE